MENDLTEKARQLFSDWESVFNPPDRFQFFEKIENTPVFDPGKLDEFSPSNAWWLAELCRVAYTPDAKESGYLKNRRKPVRADWLAPQPIFREVHSIHKTGNHASIYLGKIPDTGQPFTVLCFRGTKRFRQWVMNFTAKRRDWEFSDRASGVRGALVHSGFDILGKRIWPQLHERLLNLPRPFIFTGHSLGGALAMLAAVEEKPDQLVTFGAPKVGNLKFTELISDIPAFRIVNERDVVPHVPPIDPKAGAREFAHTGQKIQLSSEGKFSFDPDVPENIRAIDLLRDSFRKPTPPACIIDHLMTSYCRKLRTAIPD